MRTQFIGPSYITALNVSAMDFVAPNGEIDVRTYTMCVASLVYCLCEIDVRTYMMCVATLVYCV
jgi:hypothetical protein